LFGLVWSGLIWVVLVNISRFREESLGYLVFGSAKYGTPCVFYDLTL
jgi:hypothetical protein